MCIRLCIKVEHLHQELNRCESDVVSLRRDMKDLSDDLSRAVQETQLISGQLSSAQALNQRHEVRIKEMDKTLARQQEMFRSKNEEYEEILQSYFTTKSDFEVVGRDLKKCAKEIVRVCPFFIEVVKFSMIHVAEFLFLFFSFF